MLSYRRLVPEDLDSICMFPADREELYYVSPKFRYPLTPEQIMQVLEGRLSPTVIVDGEPHQPLAYSNLYDLDEERRTCWLGNVIVSRERRGSGAASFLLETMMKQARKEHNVHTLKLYCHNTNTRALLFYCKHGFIPSGYKVMSWLDSSTVVAIEMSRSLQ